MTVALRSLPALPQDGVRVLPVWQSEAPPPPLQQQGEL